MKKTIVLLLIFTIILAAVNTVYADTTADDVFDSMVAVLNSQKTVSFTFQSSDPITSVSFHTCELQKLTNNSWNTINSSLSPSFNLSTGYLINATLNCSGDISTGTYRIKYKVTANNHTTSFHYSNSHSY